MKHYHMQLQSLDGKTISATGGTCYVAVSGGARKVTLKNADGSAKTNPVALVNGAIDFYVEDTVTKVDLYGQTPSGGSFALKNVFPSGDSSVKITPVTESTIIVPFHALDGTPASEISTGFYQPTKGAALPTPLIEVVTADSGITLDVGTLSTDSGDADGFVDGVSVATAGIVKATLTNGAITMGVLLFVQDSANAGDEAPEANVSMQGKQITYTLSSGADTAEGFIRLPVALSVAGL